MKRLAKKIFSPPSLQLNAMVVFEVMFLLVASLAVLFYFSYKTLKKEAMNDAELTLQGVVQQVDNALLRVEQMTGNFYWEMRGHLDEPDRMTTYCRELVKCNPNIEGCAIVFKPGFYPGRELFMAYVHRKGERQTTDRRSSELVISESYGPKPYTEQEWYTAPMTSGRAGWIGPLKEEDGEEEILTFSLPIYIDRVLAADSVERKPVGVLAINLSVELLSEIVLTAKPSPNSYCVLLNQSGEYIVHPDKEMLKGHTVFDKTENGANPALREIAEAMLAGETGSSPFTLDGRSYYKFYKPFVRNRPTGRTVDDLNWSVGLVYPERDIFGMFHSMLKHVLIIAVVGLLLFFLLCRIIIRIQLKPLAEITETAQRIADGHYDNPMSDSKRNDEIGLFQQHFQKMQEALSSRINQLRQMNNTLQEHGEELLKTHEQILRDSQVETTLLCKMTGKMKEPSKVIGESVATLCDNYQDISLQEANSEVATIKKQSETILTLLNQMLNTSDEEEGKEVSHE